MNSQSEEEDRTSRVLAINFVVLLALMAFPAGEYKTHEAIIKVNSLSSPFADYGVLLVTSAAFLALLMIASRLYGHRRHVDPLGYVIIAGGVLGLMVPDVITSANRSIRIGASGRLIQVDLSVGFWLAFAATVLLFVVASIAFFAKSNARNVEQRESRRNTRAPELL